MNIFELTKDLVDLQNLLENEVDTLSDEELKEALALQGKAGEAYEKKVEGYAFLIKKFSYMADEAKEEISRINAIKKTYSNCVDRMKNVIRDSMLTMTKDKIDCTTIKLYLKKNSDKLVVLDEEKVPDEFTERKILKAEINKEYKGKEALPDWLSKETTEKSLVIK